MAEMLPLIVIAPESNLTLNPSTGILGAAMEGVNRQLDQLEIGIDDLYNSLDPTSQPHNSFPGREGVYMQAGTLTNMVYGFIIGMVIMVALFF
jgi:tetrahydromethanopterin S-methyltransferase subunit B